LQRGIRIAQMFVRLAGLVLLVLGIVIWTGHGDTVIRTHAALGVFFVLSLLIFGGTLDRYPGVKILAAHGGGYAAAYIGRSDHAWHARPDARGCRREPSSYLRQIFFDTIVYRPEQLRHLIAEVGASQVVIGTDYPYDMAHYDMYALLDAVPGLSEADRSAHVGHPIVEAQFGMPVAPDLGLPLPLHAPQARGQSRIARHDHATLAGRDGLVAIKAEGADLAEAPDMERIEGGAECLRAVLDDRDPVGISAAAQRMHVGVQ